MPRWWLLTGFLAASLGRGSVDTAAPARAAAPALSVLAFNVQFDAPHPERSLELIDSEGADVLCLTEVTAGFAAALEKRVGSRYPHRIFRSASGTWGVGLWSRTPLTQAAIVEQRPHRMPGAIATVSVGGHPVRLACVHLFPPGARRGGASLLRAMGENAALRKEQARSWTGRLSRGPALVLGDFNEGPDGEAVATFLRAGFANGCPACTSTFPGASSPWPALIQIDHLLARGLEVTGGRTLPGGGSDHLAVRAEIRSTDAAR